MDQTRQRNRGRLKLLAILAVCAAPVIASYVTYYVIKPEARTNYGELLDPRAHPAPPLGGSVTLDAYKGKWLMLLTGPSDCREACRKLLHDMRQLRLAQGKDMDRIERVWLVTDSAPPDMLLMREYDGTRTLHARPDTISTWLPAEPGAGPSDHLYLVDPLGNLMMRFPKDADPNKVKKDLARLLKASRIG